MELRTHRGGWHRARALGRRPVRGRVGLGFVDNARGCRSAAARSPPFEPGQRQGARAIRVGSGLGCTHCRAPDSVLVPRVLPGGCDSSRTDRASAGDVPGRCPRRWPGLDRGRERAKDVTDARNTAADTRDEILALVSRYYRERHAPPPFDPGRDPVRYAGRVFGEEELRLLVDSSLDFYLTASRFTEEFEAGVADYLGLSDALFVNSGSSANLVALTALTSPKLGERRLRPGDEVITVAAGFPSTVAPIIQNGLVPVFVDIRLGDYNADPAQLRLSLSPRTRAIMLAHTLGVPFDLDTVMELVEKHDLWLIEDNW